MGIEVKICMKTYEDTLINNTNLEFVFEWKFKNNDTKFITLARSEKEVINENSQRYNVDKNLIEILNFRILERNF